MKGTRGGKAVNRFSYCNIHQSFNEYKNLYSSFVEYCCNTYNERVFSVDTDGTPVFYTKSIKIKDKTFEEKGTDKNE